MTPEWKAKQETLKARFLDEIRRNAELAEWRKVWADELARRKK